MGTVSVDHGDSAVDFLGQLGDGLIECLGDDFLEIAHRPGDCRLINEQPFGDHVLRELVRKYMTTAFTALAQGQFPWPTSSVIPNDALFYAVNELVELLGRESCSSLAW
jgi:hypothetical protein